MRNPRAKGKTDKWLLGSFIEVKGPSNYVAKIGYVNKLVHADHMVKTFEECETELQMTEFSDPILPNFDINLVTPLSLENQISLIFFLLQ